MALIKEIKGFTPEIGTNCFLADNATIIGEVKIGDNCSIWFNTVVRGDVHYIRIGNNVNIQDGVTVHCTYKKAPVNIGNNVSIAHNAIIHGCTIHDNVLIGMGAIIMDNAVIESNTVIAAGALITENTIVKTGSVYAGVPAKLLRKADTDLVEGQIKRIAESYSMYASWYQ
ncbi:MAG: gamma carbonic anhydrase family protein [Bacteroidales bacterium]|nr:gamma carbonic anhydrase family protein [Bacteroidales bacterium]